MKPNDQAILDAVRRLTEAADTYHRYRSTPAPGAEPDPGQMRQVAAAAAVLRRVATLAPPPTPASLRWMIGGTPVGLHAHLPDVYTVYAHGVEIQTELRAIAGGWWEARVAEPMSPWKPRAWFVHLHDAVAWTVTRDSGAALHDDAGQSTGECPVSVLRALLDAATEAEDVAIRSAALRAGVLWECENCGRHTAGSDTRERCGAARTDSVADR